jgi:hypothetical protein
MEGMRNTSSRVHLFTRPLFVIVKPRSRKTDIGKDFVLKAADQLVETWRARGVPFVELFDEPEKRAADWWSSDHPVALLHRYLRNRGVSAVPVTATDRHGDYATAVSVAVKEGKQGLAIRLYENDLEIPTETLSLVGEIAAGAGCAQSSVDLLLDLQRIQFPRIPELRSRVLDLLAAIERGPNFRSITLIGSSVPADLSGVPEYEQRDVIRLELRLWREIEQARKGRFALGYGDYGVVRPEYDDRKRGFKHINAKIFYTTPEFTRVFRGRSRMKEKLESQYVKLAQKLYQSEVFRGSEFSWGDSRIAACARRLDECSMPGAWIAFATSHHVEVVSEQFARESIALV